MASTRNNNTSGDYCLQQNSYKHFLDYTQFKNSQLGMAYTNAIPCMGITPSHMPREAFSTNSIEIESSLFGINSTNLVNPQTPVKPNLINLPNVSYFDRLTNYMPEPLVVEKNQRPFPIPK
jgi:hypothetical protein